MPTHSAHHRQREAGPHETTPHNILVRQFQAEAIAPDPDHQKLSAIHRTLTRMEEMGRILWICRSCFRRHTTSRGNRHCFITCRGPHRRAELQPDPTGTLRVAFTHSPSLRDLRTEAKRRFPIPAHMAKAA